MSFLGRGPAAPSSAGSLSSERVEAAIQEVELITDVFNRIVSSCHSKCINQRYLDGELSKGESVCIDRCVAKFFDANKKMGEKLQAMGASAGGAGGLTSL
ncbi:Tim10/DDP family zinc finger-domain-containing protein [Thelephora terrestris]|uniref:Mitochondrial import inner membrane translocase subunit n=1 Tax=Thelephora terrestris TaxID=56493 RepID=A0A9P6HF39_9AGAM|nr:Tim10/DDP family zinc finger-domain-containing protein [Thelephora terrestris]